MPKAIDITGQKFGKLTVLEKAPSRSGKTYWKCQCDCGTIKDIQTCHLKNGAIQSCGSLQCKERALLEHETAQKICLICQKEFVTASATRKYCYDCSPSSKIASKAEIITAIRRAMKKEAVRRRGGKCERCGYDKSIRALSFHHRNPSEKAFGISCSGVTHNWEEYLQEVDKCDLLCANCHAEEHEQDN